MFQCRLAHARVPLGLHVHAIVLQKTTSSKNPEWQLLRGARAAGCVQAASEPAGREDMPRGRIYTRMSPSRCSIGPSSGMGVSVARRAWSAMPRLRACGPGAQELLGGYRGLDGEILVMLLAHASAGAPSGWSNRSGRSDSGLALAADKDGARTEGITLDGHIPLGRRRAIQCASDNSPPSMPSGLDSGTYALAGSAAVCTRRLHSASSTTTQ